MYRATGLTMKPSETYHVAMFLIADGWTKPLQMSDQPKITRGHTA